ncbi:hypothetical protein [Micromonospora pisi]|nr:hypothetical protein [Micromonospora pisi]
MRIRSHILAVPALAVALALTGCGGDDTTQPSTPQVTAVGPAAPAPTTAPAAATVDAKTVLDKLTAAKVGLTAGTVQDENTDPNDLLGRPNGYQSRAAADLPGGDPEGDKFGIDRGLVIEQFADTAGADTRSKFIQDTLQSLPIMGTEYHYRAGGGTVLVRVTGKVKPSDAKKIETAVAGL